jgi:hypothetical protein
MPTHSTLSYGSQTCKLASRYPAAIRPFVIVSVKRYGFDSVCLYVGDRIGRFTIETIYHRFMRKGNRGTLVYVRRVRMRCDCGWSINTNASRVSEDISWHMELETLCSNLSMVA